MLMDFMVTSYNQMGLIHKSRSRLRSKYAVILITLFPCYVALCGILYTEKYWKRLVIFIVNTLMSLLNKYVYLCEKQLGLVWFWIAFKYYWAAFKAIALYLEKISILFYHLLGIMPHYCIVLKCKNKSGTPGLSFHQLPLKKPKLLKLWLIKIKRKNPPLSRYSRVCSAHFKDGKKKGETRGGSRSWQEEGHKRTKCS